MIKGNDIGRYDILREAEQIANEYTRSVKYDNRNLFERIPRQVFTAAGTAIILTFAVIDPTPEGGGFTAHFCNHDDCQYTLTHSEKERRPTGAALPIHGKTSSVEKQ